MGVIPATPLMDSFGRRINYLRLSVTDRCDLRCQYCMSDTMRFVPRQDVLSFEETERLCRAFIALGIRKIRLTGGEPLVRPGIMILIERLGALLADGRLGELTITTNGTRLAQHADALRQNGIKRVNVSLDTLDPTAFRTLTKHGKLDVVLEGIQAAKRAGLKVKINCVVMRDANYDQLDQLISWCGKQEFDLTLIERMPFGAGSGYGGSQAFIPLSEVREGLEKKWTLTPSTQMTGGPARYVKIAETGRHLGFISALSHNFCDDCNRIRLTVQGTLAMCLGRADAVDLKPFLRDPGNNDAELTAHIQSILMAKPAAHEFTIASNGRAMSSTGG